MGEHGDNLEANLGALFKPIQSDWDKFKTTIELAAALGAEVPVLGMAVKAAAWRLPRLPKSAAEREHRRSRQSRSPTSCRPSGKMLTTAKRWGEIDIVPEISKVKVARPAFDFFDFTDADRLLGAIKDPDDRALIVR